MAQPVLPDFNTSNLDASKNGQELCNELKRLYDYLMVAVATQKFKWDSETYHYLANGLVDYVDFVKGSITIRKRYYYTGQQISYQMNYISGVPPVTGLQFVHGRTFNYDASGRITSITNRNQ